MQKKRFISFALCVAALLAGAVAHAETRLMLVGGGTLPKPALTRFAAWAGGDDATILVVAWATEGPDEAFANFTNAIRAVSNVRLAEAPHAPLDAAAKARFLAQLAGADAVYFTGGDQTRTMAVLADTELLHALRARHAEGIAFGGSSAGTAIMSRQMLTGVGDETVIDGTAVGTAAGLGLLPDGVLVDQHFVKRQRQNRLFGLLLAGPERFGMGIDEATAVLLRDGRHAEVVGATGVLMIATPGDGKRLVIDFVKAGDSYELPATAR